MCPPLATIANQADFKSRSLNFLLSSSNLTFNSKNSITNPKNTTNTNTNTNSKNVFSSSSSSSSSYCTSSSLTTSSDKNLTKSVDLVHGLGNGPRKVAPHPTTTVNSANANDGAQLFVKKRPQTQRTHHFKSSISSISSSLSGTTTTGTGTNATSTTSSVLTNYLACAPGQPNAALLHLPMRSNYHHPIQVNMSRASMKKKQMEIINEYNRYNAIELWNSLRKIQHNLDAKVKQFTNKTIKECL